MCVHQNCESGLRFAIRPLNPRQLLNAIVFLSREVVRCEPREFNRGKRLPTVLARDEVRRVLAHWEGTPGVMA